jgi:hypothetical protein
MTSKGPRRRMDGWLALAVTTGAAALYLAMLSRNYLGDGVKFAFQIERGDPVSLLQPRHLGYPLVGWWFYRLWQALGWTGRALLPLQALSALGGAACVGLMFCAAARLGGSCRAAMVAAAGFGVSRGVWLYATDAESVAPSLALALGVLLGLLGDGAGQRPGRVISVGLLWGLSVLMHASNVLILPAIVTAYLFVDAAPLRARLTRLGLCLGAGTAIVVVGYGLAMEVVLGADAPTVTNMGGLLGLGEWSAWEAKDLAHGAYGFLKALVGYPGLGPDASTATFIARSTRGELARFVAYYGAAALAAVAPLAAFVRRTLARGARRDRWALAILGAWAAAHGAAAVVWVPGDVQFWAPVLAPWWLGVALLLRPTATPSRAPVSRVPVGLAIGLAATIVVANAWSFALPNRRIANNRAYQVTLSLAERTGPDDVLLITGADRLGLYLPYFAGRWPLRMPDLLPGGDLTEEDLARATIERARQAAAAGGRTYLAGFQPGAEARWDELDGQGLVRGALRRIPTTPAWEVAGETILLVSTTR